jgi:hypothetical protein
MQVSSEHGFATAKDPKQNSVTDISGTTVTNDTPTDTLLHTNSYLR